MMIPSQIPRIVRVAAFMIVLALARTAPAELITSTWLGGTGEGWSVAANWFPDVVPDNGADTFDVLIDDGTADVIVHVDDSITVDRLTIDNGDTVLIDGNASLAVDGGPINNAGVIAFDNPDAVSAGFAVAGAEGVILRGGGVLALTNSQSLVNGRTTTERLINEDNTIEGAGQLGRGFMSLTNQGLIDATLSTPLEVSMNADGAINTGTMQASAGSELWLRGTSFQNFDDGDSGDDGVIQSLADALVRIEHSTIIGGVLWAHDLGEIELSDSSMIGGELKISGLVRVTGSSTIAASVSNADGGRVVIEPKSSLALDSSGEYGNAGDIRLNHSGGGGTTLHFTGDVVHIGGGGTITMSDDPGNLIQGAHATERLINMDNTIRGAGRIGGPGFMSLENRGVIDADGANALRIRSNADGFDNQGELHVSGAGGMTIADPFTTSGTVAIEADRKLTRTGDYPQTAGRTTVDGELEVNEGVVDLQGGVVDGSGLVDGDVENVGGVVEPGTNAGVLTVEGAYTQLEDGALVIEIAGLAAGNEHDQIAVSGVAQLGGRLDVRLIDGFQPTVGDTFIVMTASPVVGAFRCPDLDGLVEGAQMTVGYDETSVTITVVAGDPSPGDVNRDGVVNFGDLLLILGQWGECASECCPEDISGDGNVTFADILEILSNWS